MTAKRSYAEVRELVTDTEVLETARRLVTRYFHPSRSGGDVPSPDLSDSLNLADSILAIAARRAAERGAGPPELAVVPDGDPS